MAITEWTSEGMVWTLSAFGEEPAFAKRAEAVRLACLERAYNAKGSVYVNARPWLLDPITAGVPVMRQFIEDVASVISNLTTVSSFQGTGNIIVQSIVSGSFKDTLTDPQGLENWPYLNFQTLYARHGAINFATFSGMPIKQESTITNVNGTAEWFMRVYNILNDMTEIVFPSKDATLEVNDRRSTADIATWAAAAWTPIAQSHYFNAGTGTSPSGATHTAFRDRATMRYSYPVRTPVIPDLTTPRSDVTAYLHANILQFGTNQGDPAIVLPNQRWMQYDSSADTDGSAYDLSINDVDSAPPDTDPIRTLGWGAPQGKWGWGPLAKDTQSAKVWQTIGGVNVWTGPFIVRDYKVANGFAFV